MFGKKDELQYNRVNTLIDKNCELEGLLRSQGTVRIDGIFRGEIIVEGNLFVGEGGKVIGNIHTQNLLVAGNVEGNVNATGQLRIAATGSLLGDVHVKTFILDESSIFEGNCKMYRDKPALPAEPVVS